MIPKIFTFVKTPEPEPKEEVEGSEEEEESEYEEEESEEKDERNQSLLEIAEFLRSTGERFMDYVGWKKQTAVIPLFPIPVPEEEEEEEEDEEEGEEEEEEEGEEEEYISEIEGQAQDIEISNDISIGKSPREDTLEDANKTMFQPDLTSQDDEERDWKFGKYYDSLTKIDEGLTSSALILKCMLNQIQKEESDGVSNIQDLDIDDLLFKQLDQLEFK